MFRFFVPEFQVLFVMPLKKLLFTILKILTIVITVISHHEIDISVESEGTVNFDSLGDLQSCKIVSSLNVSDFDTKIRHTEIQESRKSIKMKSIEAIHIKRAPNLKFLPFGLKNFLPKLKAIDVQNSGLMHLDQLDMEPFGIDLVYIRFFRTELTYLEGVVFEFNSNLVYVDFGSNPFQHIDLQLFINLKHFRRLEEFSLFNCDCIDKTYRKSAGHDINAFNWSSTCNDTLVEKIGKQQKIERFNKLKCGDILKKVHKENILKQKFTRTLIVNDDFQSKVLEANFSNLTTRIGQIKSKIEKLDESLGNIDKINSKINLLKKKLNFFLHDHETIIEVLRL